MQASIHYTIGQVSLLNDDKMQKNDLISVKVYTIEGNNIHLLLILYFLCCPYLYNNLMYDEITFPVTPILSKIKPWLSTITNHGNYSQFRSFVKDCVL